MVIVCSTTYTYSFLSGSDGHLHPQISGILPHLIQPGGFGMDPRDIDVEVDCVLGRGAGGFVTRAIHRPSGTPLAIKQVVLQDKSKRDQLMNDIRALIEGQRCEYLVRLFAAYIHGDSGRVHLALEFMDRGSLEDLLKRVKQPIPERVLSAIVKQILEGLSFLHGNKLIHRDIKPGNILLHSDGSVKISDFGISKTLDNTANICDTFVGTATYMSPERALGKDYSFSSDIWSVGMIVYEAATGRYPFPSLTSFPVLFDHLCHRPEPRLDSDAFSPELQDFVSRCLDRDPARRYSAMQLLDHPCSLLGSRLDLSRYSSNS
jgi:serine/threonine protein kinase